MRRCGETISHAALNFGVSSISIEEGLVESINSDWYRSWGVPGADSTWGGPRGGKREFEKEELDERVFQVRSCEERSDELRTHYLREYFDCACSFGLDAQASFFATLF